MFLNNHIHSKYHLENQNIILQDTKNDNITEAEIKEIKKRGRPKKRRIACAI